MVALAHISTVWPSPLLAAVGPLSSVSDYSVVWFCGLIVGGLFYVPFFVIVAVRAYAHSGSGFSDGQG